MKNWVIPLIILIFLPLCISSYSLSLLTQVLIFGLLAMSLDILIGYTGLVSFNHASFFGVGAYTVGILATRGLENFPLSMAAGIAASAILALVLSPIVLRSSGPYFLMITLAFGQMVFALAWRWRSLTGGDDGLPGVPRPDLGVPFNLWDNLYFYYLVLIFFIISFFLLWQFVQSDRGKAIMGVRENEARMLALGYNTFILKVIAYTLAGAFSGLAGGLYVYYTGFISPQELNWTMSGLIILMVIVGGTGTLIGPIIGAGIIIVIQNIISSYTERWPLFMGIIFILCVIYARKGVVGYLYKFIKGGKNHEGLGS